MPSAKVIFFISLEIIALTGSLFSARTPFIWFFIALSFVAATVFCLRYSNKKALIIILVLLCLAQHMAYLGPQYAYAEPWFSDSWGDYVTADLIHNSSHWVPGMNSGLYRVQTYSLYPAVHIVGVVLGDVFGAPIYNAARLSLPVAADVSIAILIFLLFKLLLKDDKKAGLASIIFFTNFWFAYFNAQFDREVFAFPLLLACILCFYLYCYKSDRLMGILGIVLSTAVVMSHFIVSIILFFILLGMFLFYRKRFILVSYVLPVTVLWATYATSWSYSLGTLNNLFSNIINSILAVNTPIQSAPMGGSSEPLALLSYTGYLALGLLVLVGLLKLKSQSRMTQFVFLAGVCLFFIAGISRLFASGWSSGLFLRILPYSYLGLAGCAAVGGVLILGKQKGAVKGFFSLGLVVLLICVMSLGSVSQQSFIVYPPVADVSNTLPVYRSSQWAGTYSYPNAKIAFTGEEYMVAMKSLDRSEAVSLYGNLLLFSWDNSSPEQRTAYHGLFLIDGASDYSRPVNLIFNVPDMQLGYS